VKSIGISTFGMRHMQELFDSGQQPPAVHQVCTIQLIQVYLESHWRHWYTTFFHR
jgi:diketogulonate reductase-like aldo/keto reductase